MLVQRPEQLFAANRRVTRAQCEPVGIQPGHVVMVADT